MSDQQFTMPAISSLVRVLAYSAVILEAAGKVHDNIPRQRAVCTVEAGGSNSTDDAPAIISAFKECGQGGTVKFSNTTYYVNSVMEITGLDDCEIDLQGTLQVRPLSSRRTTVSINLHYNFSGALILITGLKTRWMLDIRISRRLGSWGVMIYFSMAMDMGPSMETGTHGMPLSAGNPTTREGHTLSPFPG